MDNSIEKIIALVNASTQGNFAIAHSQLRDMAENPKEFIDTLMKIVTLEDTNVAPPLVKQRVFEIAVFTLTDFFKCSGAIEDKSYVISALFKSVFHPNADPRFANRLLVNLRPIFLLEWNAPLRKHFLTEAKEKLNYNNFEEFRAALSMILTVLPSFSGFEMAGAFGFIHEKILSESKPLVEAVENLLMQFKPENIDFIILRLEALQVWTQIIFAVHKELSKPFQHNKQNTIPNFQTSILENEFQATVLLKILMLQVQNDKQTKAFLFSNSGIELVDSFLNNAKSNALRCYNVMLGMTRRNETVFLSNVQTNKFYLFSKSHVLALVFQSLFVGCQDYPSLEEKLQITSFKDCVTACIEFLARVVPFKKPDNPFYDKKEYLALNICLSMIGSNKLDLKELTQDPERFFEKTSNFDIENDNNDKDLRMRAIQLLQELCEHIDGALTSITLHIQTLLEYSLISNDLSLLSEKKYQRLKPFAGSPIFTVIEPKIRIEACLLALTGLNESIKSRPDLIQLLENMFLNYFDNFMRFQEDTLLQVRTAHLLGLYLPNLFKNNEDAYRQYLFLLIEWAGLKHPEKEIVASQVTVVLYKMIEDNDNLQRMRPFFVEMIEGLSSQVLHTKCTSTFDALYEIINEFDLSSIPDGLKELVGSLCNRMNVEFDIFRTNKQTNRKIIVNKIWNIIRAIGEKDTYPALQIHIEDILTPIFIKAIQEDFQGDEDILQFISSTTHITKSVSPLAWDILNLLPLILKRYRSAIEPLFPALNQIISHGSSKINKNENTINMLVDMALEALQPQMILEDIDVTLSFATLFCHQLLEYILIPKEKFRTLLEIYSTKLVEPNTSDLLKAKFAEVLLLALMHNFEITQEYLTEDPSQFKSIITIFANQVPLFADHSYDQKIYIICLSKLLTKPDLHPIIKENASIIFENLVSFLTYLQYIERQRSQQRDGRKLSDDSDDDDDIPIPKSTLQNMLLGLEPPGLGEDKKEDKSKTKKKKEDEDGDEDEDEDENKSENEDDDEDNDDSGSDNLMAFGAQQEINMYLRKMESRIKREDEFEAFKSAIGELKRKNPQLLKECTTKLSNTKKLYLREIMQIQKIVIDAKSGAVKARKILKAIGPKIIEDNA